MTRQHLIFKHPFRPQPASRDNHTACDWPPNHDPFPVWPRCFALHVHALCGPASSLEAAWESRHGATLRGEVGDCGLYFTSDDSCIQLHIATRLSVSLFVCLCVCVLFPLFPQRHSFWSEVLHAIREIAFLSLPVNVLFIKLV